ncbi:MAG: hypothetical protein NC254_08430 [bacterium]|nr:hypothetical protein [bacterium]
MKRANKIIGNLFIAAVILLIAPFSVFASEANTLEQIYAAGDYHVGSIYGPRLNQTELDQVAQAVLTFVESYDWTEMDDFTKVSCAHQYLCDICEYAPDWSKNRANTAWGALVYGEAQCSGYARAFKALCDAIGIGCYYVHADENASNPSHQWNEVCVDGVWYIVDVQCNDDAGFPVFYLVSGDTYAYLTGMSWNHDGLPECTKDYGYDEAEYGWTEREVIQSQPLRLQDIPVGSGTRETITDTESESYFVNEYDENGYLIKKIYCSADGTVWSIEEYGENGNKVKVTDYNSDGTIWVICEYEENGRYEKYTYYDGGKVDFFVISEYEFKENWKREKSTFYHADGTVDFGTLTEYAYDESGKEVESVSYYADGTFDDHKIHEYDGNGNEVRCIHYNEDGTLSSYKIYEYDRDGNKTKVTFYDADGTVTMYIFHEYDEEGKELRCILSNADQTSSLVFEF